MKKKVNTTHQGYPKQAMSAIYDYRKQHKIFEIFSPMEADFQIAALQRSGEIQASFTNDSDQLVLGCDLVA